MTEVMKWTLVSRQQLAARKIQAAFRGSQARREFVAYRSTVVALQCCWRRKLARRELRARRQEAREAGKLLKDKAALDEKLKETLAILETVQNQRNELRQLYKVLLLSRRLLGRSDKNAKLDKA